MTEQPATWQRVTVAEAAEVLGVSTATVRRMLKRGQLEGERVTRPQGSAFVVRLPVDASAAPEDATATRRAAGVTPRGNASASELMAAWSATFLAPIMARMAEQETTVREQAETIGSLRAQLAAADERIRMLEAPRLHDETEPETPIEPPPTPEPPTPEPPTPEPNGRPEELASTDANSAPWWRRWWVWVLL